MTNELLINRLNDLKNNGFFDDLVIKRGIEKEFFRVDKKGFISKRSHPKSLGSALKNKYITTDFSEAQVELVTPTFEDVDELYDFLYSLHVFVANNIEGDEMLWPFSMPPKIKDESEINIGYYHQSGEGLLKHVYRRGLKVRYGATMQCVSGMHYNFSINQSSFSTLINSTDQKSINEAYLGLMRNFKRIFWFVLSEFGQTNVVDKSFVKNRNHSLNELNKNDLYLENATSLRMSEIGYQSEAQKSLDIKYNSLSGFLQKIKDAITVPFEDYKKKGLLDSNGEYHQISDGIIQIENEYYDSIRPKRSASNNLRPYDLLKDFGIEYLEIRGVDISPSDITGMSKHHIRFLDLILIYCLISPSPKMTSKEKNEIDSNERVSIYEGKSKSSKININGNKVSIKNARKDIFENLKNIADFMNDRDLFHAAINHVTKLPKGELPKVSFHKDGIEKSKSNLSELKSSEGKYIDSIKKEAELSLEELEKMHRTSEEEMNEFVKNYNLSLLGEKI
ncbi:MAG: glutamate--cysteine ligase [Gammaproteobacteria bacterium]|tara:strand:+ start:1723 stop:3243 length:1521 start_codon:yes stop_codon:yes gene_type:complete